MKRSQLIVLGDTLTASQKQASFLQAIAFNQERHHADTELLKVSRGAIFEVSESLVPRFQEVKVQESRVVRLIVVRYQEILAVTIITRVLVLEGAEIACRRNGHGV